MRFMNEHQVYERAVQYRDHEVLGPATQTVVNLMHWANRNSDGWVYWPKPARAAASLMALIEGDALDDPYQARFGERPDATAVALRKALSPVKAFRTRQGADFEIVTALTPPDLDDVPEPSDRIHKVRATDRTLDVIEHALGLAGSEESLDVLTVVKGWRA